MTREKLLSFDLDDTLWPMRPVLLSMEQRLMDWFAGTAPRLVEQFDLEQVRQRRLQLWKDRPDLHHQISRWRQTAMLELLLEAGYPQQESESLARRAMSQLLLWRNEVTLFDHVNETLQQLSRDYIIIGITNGNADVFRTPAGRWFDSALRAEQVDISKPHPDIFHAAIAPYGIAPGNCIHVGDHPENDVAGALGAGMKAIHCAADNTPHAETDCGVPKFRQWRDLPAVLESL